MIYKSKDGEIDLSKITRLYPAAVINMYGEVAEMSLEWMDDYASKVELMHYILVFDFTKPGEEVKNKKVLTFATKDELIATMTEVAQFFQK
jgi:hypothetical protein